MNRITEDPDQMDGAPCIRGLRIPVTTVIACLADGMTWDEVLRAYPDLERDDIVEALRYAQLSISADPTPGMPRPSGNERPEDLVDTEGMDPEDARVYLEAARMALSVGIEPGLRRARWIEGYVAGRSQREKR